MRALASRVLPVALLSSQLVSPGHSQTTDNPLVGYSSYKEFYTIPYADGSGLTAPNGPRISAVIAGTPIVLPVDTGSRALYASQDLVPNITNPEGPVGFVYLNSSARIFEGAWSTQTVTFPDAVGSKSLTAPAQAVVPVLVVDTLACSTTPPPGSATATTTFRTIPESGTVVLTNGTTVPFTGYTLTLTGGQAVSYADNPGILASVVNFGVGFDRTGQGTSPNNDRFNQQYNAFLNVLQMRANPPTMRAGFVLEESGIRLGLTSEDSGYAYTNLIPTGLTQNPPSPPDWQAPMGSLVYGGAASATGQVVVDTGIDFSILTLPGLTGTTAPPPLTVNLLNSGGAVRYEINDDPDNTLAPTQISVFPPLAGNFSENSGATRDQFFNTGRRVLNAFDFLYDAADGYVGLRQHGSVSSAKIAFASGFYPAPIPPDPETVTIPLAVFDVSKGSDSSPTYKLGIYVGLGGGAPQLYEFDTGGQGFFAAQNTNAGGWWPASSYNVVDPGQSFTATYSSGITYTAQLVTTDVAIYGSGESSAAPVATINANVGQITDATATSTDLRRLNWTGYESDQNTPPVWEHFYGDFGANLNPYAGSNFLINTILPQLPGNLSSGFILHVGSYGAPDPWLQLGLTAADRASFPIQLPLLDANPAQPYPNSGYPSYGFFQTWGYFTLGLNGLTQTSPTEVILDTGAPSMTIRTGSALTVDGSFLDGSAVKTGTAFSLASGPWTLAFTAGSETGWNAIAAAPSVNKQNLYGYINTGLNAFFSYDVMVDVERGVIGFRSTTPAPAPPVVRIDGPKTVRTPSKRIRVKGIVRSSAPVAAVEFQRNSGGYIRAQGGGKRWNFLTSLKKGRNVFRVRATNTSGVSGAPAKVVIVRRG